MDHIPRRLKKVRHYYSALGCRGVAALGLAKLFGKNLTLSVKLEGISHPVYVRIATTDVSVLKQVLI